MDFQIDFHENYFLGTTSGLAEVNKFGDLLDAIFEHEKWQPGMSYIIDYTELDASNISADDVQRIAQLAKFKREKVGVARSAIVAPRDLEYGLSRMWSVYVENDDGIATAVFRTLEEAIDWVSV